MRTRECIRVVGVTDVSTVLFLKNKDVFISIFASSYTTSILLILPTEYRRCYPKFGYIYPNSIEISHFEVKGFAGCFNKNGKSFVARRTGDRLIVPNEEAYLSQRQRDRDAKMAEAWKRRAIERQREKDERYGNDIEVVRGGVSVIKNSGLVEWSVRWEHEPARGGQAGMQSARMHCDIIPYYAMVCSVMLAASQLQIEFSPVYIRSLANVKD